MPSLASLPPCDRDRASFAVMSRLISCFVTEQILRAYYVPFHDPLPSVVGVLVVLSTHTISENVDIFRTFHPSDVYVIVPLQNPPVLRNGQARKHGFLVGLVDPLDMFSPMYEFGEKHEANTLDNFSETILDNLRPPPWDLATHGSLRRVADPVALWRKFVETVFIPENLRDVIAEEIQSSLDWQTVSYQNPPQCPTLDAPSIHWEQSLVAGHPTHPMHRARMLHPDVNSLEYDWYHPKIRFVRISRSRLTISGDFVDVCKSLATKAAQNARRKLIHDDDHIFMPVHELQIDNIEKKFEDIEVLDPEVHILAQAQSSIRTVVIPELPELALKLAVGVKISSSLRTISHFTADFGPRFSAYIIPKLSVDQRILTVETEPSSAVYNATDPELTKHFTAVIRQEYLRKDGEALIVVAALLETGHANIASGVSAIEHTFMLDTEEKKAVFLDSYIKIACEAMIPALIENGVAFEAHAQNVLARFDIATKELRGFVIRDLGGLRIHPPTLRQSTGIDFQFLPGHCVATQTLEEIFPKFYHTFVHNHIQRLIRLLGLHYNGLGWEMLRKHMATVIPEEHPVWKVWMDPNSATVDSKCLMRMRMRDSYRDMVYSPYPNMIQFRPQLSTESGQV